jgi:hypothetical protein
LFGFEEAAAQSSSSPTDNRSSSPADTPAEPAITSTGDYPQTSPGSAPSSGAHSSTPWAESSEKSLRILKAVTALKDLDLEGQALALSIAIRGHATG